MERVHLLIKTVLKTKTQNKTQQASKYTKPL